MTDDVLTQEAVAAMLGCELETIQSRAASGDLPGLKFGRGWVFPRQALVSRLNEIALEESHKRRAPPKLSAAGIQSLTPKSRRKAPVQLPSLP